MSTWGKCPLCRDYGFLDGTFMEHRCKPVWECRPAWSDEDDDWQEVYAHDAESAAEKFAERYDCEGGEYCIVSSRVQDAVIHVRKPNDETFERWAIQAETVPTYRASKMEVGE